MVNHRSNTTDTEDLNRHMDDPPMPADGPVPGTDAYETAHPNG
jgi:hypothetical protein